MKITIVSGLLGSGKTTFIRHIAAGSPQRTVVLVNDFGKAGIDGEVLSNSGIDSVELPSGCICCTLRADLITSIRRIAAELSPEHLIIEPSGIASPSGVLDALAELGLFHYTVVGIVDATEFAELYEAEMYGNFFREQVTLSDVVLINKVDLAGEDLVQKTADLIGLMNPAALIYRTVRAAVDEYLPEHDHERGARIASGRRLHFDALSLTVHGRISAGSIRDFFGDLLTGGFGKVVRAKALLQTETGPVRVDLASGTVTSEQLARPVTYNRLVIIGEALKQDLIFEAASLRWETGRV